ncbi:hypothetical protein RIF29_28718 [Crotalaria pallida]|uniref:Protein kinase domain-containing protein n=1 Tax=Crotalaria pallida TaxID=3830 RepID=A0AAN9HZM8_CROPI
MERETSSSPSTSRYGRQTLVSICFTTTIFLLLLQQTCDAKHHKPCPTSSCGKITNITHPFRLKGDPSHCGDKRFEFDCINNNNERVLTLFSGKFHVQHINYTTYVIRVTDAGVVEDAACSFIPRYYLYDLFIYPFGPFSPRMPFDFRFRNTSQVAYFNCTGPVVDEPLYVKVDMSPRCGYGGHVYAVWQQQKVSEIKVGCGLIVATLASKRLLLELDAVGLNGDVSYDDLHKVMVEGFEMSVLPVTCSKQEYAATDKCGISSQLIIDYIRAYLNGIIIGIYRRITFSSKQLGKPFLLYTEGGLFMGQNILPSLLALRYLFGVAFLLLLLLYKWRRRHLSMYGDIEIFLLDNNLNPIRYEYKEIKKMTSGFKGKLGQGGFGSVYKGKLRSGPDVAIKMLNKINPNGQDFINEVATIGRIHHVNVVRLVGYCVDGKKCALVYEYMPNGSLDKYIFSKEGSVPLSYAKIYEISLGIARGIAYLHQGCDMQILHFDIKPHNILLDDNFIPKISDFGLAKLYPVDDSIVTLTAARGTLGYMAPELFYRNIGGVSYKVDVYSFGMLLMEMTSRRKNTNPHAEQSSKVYFPFWIHDQFNEEKDIEMEDASEDDKALTKKMFIVALWCIQLKPSDRPSMSKVVEMLEGNIESLKMPPKPSFYPLDDGSNSDRSSWSDSSSDNSFTGEAISNHGSTS